MKLLFADYSTPEEHARKELACKEKAANNPRRVWWDVLIEQCINAAIVGGIAGLAATEWDVGLKAFGIAFLVEMRKYRKL